MPKLTPTWSKHSSPGCHNIRHTRRAPSSPVYGRGSHWAPRSSRPPSQSGHQTSQSPSPNVLLPFSSCPRSGDGLSKKSVQNCSIVQSRTDTPPLNRFSDATRFKSQPCSELAFSSPASPLGTPQYPSGQIDPHPTVCYRAPKLHRGVQPCHEVVETTTTGPIR